MALIIVESPTKSRTLQKFLGKDYKVLPSYGHIRDLPKSELGVDTKNNFKPKYIVPVKARKNLNILKKAAEKAKTVILATDPDREGEAIAWHLVQALQLGKPQAPNSKLPRNLKPKTQNSKPYVRIAFHEITKKAIEDALKNPRDIDINLVNAQQARRVLDRLVGYKLSPLLWKKVARGLSAGRVQSVAVRLICDREKEIRKFKPEEYWSIEALLQKQVQNSKSIKTEFSASLAKKDNKTIPKLGIKSKEEAEKIIKDLENAKYKVINIEKKEIKRNPFPPFTTSTLQQEAWKKLHFSAKFTMKLAQNLYERGLITYHRTDSLNLSEESLEKANAFIKEEFGKNYASPRKFKTKQKGAQEAHEAIRPTHPANTPEKARIKAKLLDNSLYRLYGLIWKRFIASQMSPAHFDSIDVEIKARNYTFKASGQHLKFDGFLKAYPIKFKETTLPPLKKDELLNCKKIIPAQHFTKPPSRYTEASLIKTLEKEGIGRPSTYAPVVSTIQTRGYVEKNQEKKFQPTELGEIVNKLLTEHFPEIVDIKFTAHMEEDLDKIAQGKENWQKSIQQFYQPFEKQLEKKYKELSKDKIAQEKTDKTCPLCGAPLIIKFGRYGKFYACSNFPKCKYTSPLEKKKLGIKCPKCKIGELVEKRTKRGKIFYACSRWPDCDFAIWDKPTSEKCPKCGSLLVYNKSKKIIKCSNKNCDFSRKATEEEIKKFS
ncbi:type I DNA topoisomerase [bacterium]|nr:type I DNA topoisomerase [bacterium]